MKKRVLIWAILFFAGACLGEIRWKVESTGPDCWRWEKPEAEIKNFLVLVFADTFYRVAPIAYKEQTLMIYSLKDSGQSVLLAEGELLDFVGHAAIAVVAKLADDSWSNQSPKIWAKTKNEKQIILPTEFMLLQNYPNPFNGMTTIIYELPESSRVVLKVFSASGRLVETLVNEGQAAGVHFVVWRAENAPSGAYFYRLETEKRVRVRKMILTK